MKDYTYADRIGFVQLVDSMGDDKKIVDSARVSFGRERNAFDSIGDYKLIKYLLSNKHSSPFEHVVFTFMVKTPLFVARQWMRHRTFSFNEISRRYTSEEIEFYIPSYFRRQSMDDKQSSSDKDRVYKVWGIETDRFTKSYTDTILEMYNGLLRQGVSREQARMFLPQNMYTKFYVTGNLWNWFRFIELRRHSHAQWEIQKPTEIIEKMLSNNVPITMKIWGEIKNQEVG